MQVPLSINFYAIDLWQVGPTDMTLLKMGFFLRDKYIT